MSHQIMSLIDREVKSGNVICNTFDGLTMYSYSRDCMYKKRWNNINKRCRGIIFDQNAKIICRPFDKFFNLDEFAHLSKEKIAEKLKEPYEITKKFDGSMISLFYYNGWKVATKSQLNSKHTRYAQSIIDGIDLENLPKDLTYVLEMIADWDRKVVCYDRDFFAVLAAFENTWEQNEVPRERLGRIFDGLPFYINNPVQIDDILNYKIPNMVEGFVIKFNDGNRIKIKSKWYFIMSKLVEVIQDVVVAEDHLQTSKFRNQRDDNMLDYLIDVAYGHQTLMYSANTIPTHIHDKIRKIIDIIGCKKLKIEEEVEKALKSVEHLPTLKDKATTIIRHYNKELQNVLFCKLKYKDDWNVTKKYLKSHILKPIS